MITYSTFVVFTLVPLYVHIVLGSSRRLFLIDISYFIISMWSLLVGVLRYSSLEFVTFDADDDDTYERILVRKFSFYNALFLFVLLPTLFACFTIVIIYPEESISLKEIDNCEITLQVRRRDLDLNNPSLVCDEKKEALVLSFQTPGELIDFKTAFMDVRTRVV